MELLILLFYFSLITFGFDFLSNKYIKANETKIGLLVFFHHLVHNVMLLIPLFLFIDPSFVLITSLLVFFNIANALWIKNSDHCFLTEYINELIDPNTKYYKWRSSFSEFIKHYTRGDSWGYSNINNYNKTHNCLIFNLIIIIILLKKGSKVFQFVP